MRTVSGRFAREPQQQLAAAGGARIRRRQPAAAAAAKQAKDFAELARSAGR